MGIGGAGVLVYGPGEGIDWVLVLALGTFDPDPDRPPQYSSLQVCKTPGSG